MFRQHNQLLLYNGCRLTLCKHCLAYWVYAPQALLVVLHGSQPNGVIPTVIFRQST